MCTNRNWFDINTIQLSHHNTIDVMETSWIAGAPYLFETLKNSFSKDLENKDLENSFSKDISNTNQIKILVNIYGVHSKSKMLQMLKLVESNRFKGIIEIINLKFENTNKIAEYVVNNYTNNLGKVDWIFYLDFKNLNLDLLTERYKFPNSNTLYEFDINYIYFTTWKNEIIPTYYGGYIDGWTKYLNSNEYKSIPANDYNKNPFDYYLYYF